MSIRKRRVLGLATTVGLVIGALGATIAIAATAVSGAGSTLAAPVYMQWGNDIKSKVALQYNPSGSGAGIAALQAGTVGFAASDPPLGPADKAGLKKGPIVQIPTVLGAITISYNLKGVKSGMFLDGPTIANIYLGKIKKWNDPAIQKLNKKTKLPNTAITVVHRSDSSGTTKGFTTFLAAYSGEWKSKVGVDKTVNWPTGTGAEKNSGVAAAVKQKGGSIGYVEQSYALQNHFTYANVKNAKGKFIAPTLPSTSAAATGIKPPADLGFVAINSPAKGAYPIVSQTFIDVYQDSCNAGTMNPAAATAFGQLIKYGLSPAGQKSATRLSYAGLPPKILAAASKAAASLKCNGKSIGA
jgi:phosphate transport system substrate-binding protein